MAATEYPCLYSHPVLDKSFASHLERKELLCESVGCLLPQKYPSCDFHNKSINTSPSIPAGSQTASLGSNWNYSYLGPEEFLCLFQLELNLLPLSSLFFRLQISFSKCSSSLFSLFYRDMSLVEPCCSLLRQWNNLFSAWRSSFCMAIWAAGLRPQEVLINAMDHVERLMLRSQKGWWKKTLALFCSCHRSEKSKDSTKCIHGALCQGDLIHSRIIHCLQHLWRSWKKLRISWRQ